MKLCIIDNKTLETIDEYDGFKADGKDKAKEFGEIMHSEVFNDVYEKYWVEVK